MKHDFSVRALRLWDAWLDELNEELNLSDSSIGNVDGTIVLLNTVDYSKLDDANFNAIRKSLQDYHEPFEDIDPTDIEWLDPESGLRPERAIYIPREGSINPIDLLQRLERSFISAGGILITEPGLRIERNTGRVD